VRLITHLHLMPSLTVSGARLRYHMDKSTLTTDTFQTISEGTLVRSTIWFEQMLRGFSTIQIHLDFAVLV